jgi:hypothetical protein
LALPIPQCPACRSRRDEPCRPRFPAGRQRTARLSLGQWVEVTAPKVPVISGLVVKAVMASQPVYVVAVVLLSRGRRSREWTRRKAREIVPAVYSCYYGRV